MKNFLALNEFIDNWKELSFNYYMDLRSKKKELYDEIRGLDFDERCERQWAFYRKHGKTNVFFAEQNSQDQIKAHIERDGEARKIQFVARINKKVGDIKEANLTMGADLSINGTVVGDKGKATVYSIIAGGYNIQKAHYRVLVKEVA
mgnify:CR=1 FL=1|jgi:hypothetical protein